MFDTADNENSLLIIEKNEEKRNVLSTFFSSKYACDETDSIDGAVLKIHEKEYSVVLASISQTGANGLDLVPSLQSLSPRTVPVFISDSRTPGHTVRAFRAGAFEVIQMPFTLKKVETVVEKAMGQFEIKCLKDSYQYHLEELVAERTVEVDKALEEIENSYRMTLKALVQALETRDFETHGHSERVVTFSLRLGHEVGLDKDAMRDLELGALLHDIGKIGVPDAVLRKPAKLDEEEWAKMRLHPHHGQMILRNIPFLEGAARIVAQHHEQWDGSGYPTGLRGEAIDIGARIFAVVDAFDAMVSDRVYRKGRPYEAALEELERCSGQQFDPMMIEAFKQIPKQDWEILRERSLMDKQEVLSFQAIVSELVYAHNRQLELVH
jgi:response regulator RpfG family c-di-GMP phosphodiesterase